MPTFFRFDGIKIDLYLDDHHPPHFHALYGEHEELIEIETLEVYRGRLPVRQHKKVIKWAAENQEVLRELWKTLRQEEV